MDISDIIDGIDAALSDRRTGRRWVSLFVSSMSPDDLERAVMTDFDPWAAAVRKYHLDDPRVAFLARVLLRTYWDGRGGIEESLTDVRRVRMQLARNPRNREALGGRETKGYLNRMCQRAYDSIYKFAWGQ